MKKEKKSLFIELKELKKITKKEFLCYLKVYKSEIKFIFTIEKNTENKIKVYDHIINLDYLSAYNVYDIFEILNKFNEIFISEDDITDFLNIFTNNNINSEKFSIEALKKGNLFYNIKIKIKGKGKKFKALTTIKILDRFLDKSFVDKITDDNNDIGLKNYQALLIMYYYLNDSIKSNEYFTFYDYYIFIFKNCYSISNIIYQIYMKIYKQNSFFILRKYFKQSIGNSLYGLYYKEDKKIRPSYFGGRTEIFKNFDENINNSYYFYDINNFYPNIMENTELPCSTCLVHFLNIMDEKRTKQVFNKEHFYGFAKIEFYCDPKIVKVPLLLQKDKNNFQKNKAVFGGPFVGTYYSEEIKLAIKMGYVVTYLELYSFRKQIIFKKIIKDFKKEYHNIIISKKLFKLFINRLYGYFGIDYYDDKKKLFNYKLLLDNKISILDIEKLTEIAPGKDAIANVKNNNNKPNVSISSAIAAEGRILLYNLLIKYYENLLYVDTDSIFLNKKLSDDMIGPEIGKLKDVYSDDKIVDVIFLAPKFYCLKFETGREKLVIKGFDESQLIWSFNDLKNKFITAIKNNKNEIIIYNKQNKIPITFEIDNKTI